MKSIHTCESAMKSDQEPTAKQKAYDAWYDEQVRLGIEDVDAGRVVSHAEAMRHWDDLFQKLEKKQGSKVA